MTVGEFRKVCFFGNNFDKQCIICDGWLDEEIVYKGKYRDIPTKLKKLEIAIINLERNPITIYTTRYFIETREYWFMPQDTINKLLSGDIKPFNKKPNISKS